MGERKPERLSEAEGGKRALPWTIACVLLIPAPIAASGVLAHLLGWEWLILLWIVVPGVVCAHIALRRIGRTPGNKVHREVVGTLQGLGYAVVVLRLVCCPAMTGPGGESYRRAACKYNLKTIGLAMHMYAEDFDGWFPIGPEGTDSSYALGMPAYGGQTYLQDANAFLCPSSEDSFGHWLIEGGGRSAAGGGLRPSSTSYEYVPGFRNDSLPDLMVAFDDAPRSHQRPRYGCIDAAAGRNVLFVDGHVEWMLEKDFLKRMEWQREMMERMRQGEKYVPFEEWREGEAR